MKRIISCVAVLLLALSAIPSAEAAFVIGGENGWQLSTDGIVDIFGHYRTTSPAPAGHSLVLLGDNDQNFGVTVGLLPSVVAFNVKAPTVNGVDSTVRIGIYPSVQNKSQASRLDVSPNIDFREIYYTAKGKYGELLAGRALNLYQGKNILTDMTLLTAGVVPGTVGSTTLGHIGYGYLYTNFGPQIRYTTPDLSGVKVALSVNEPYNVSADTAKTNVPRIETEISYATVLGGGRRCRLGCPLSTRAQPGAAPPPHVPAKLTSQSAARPVSNSASAALISSPPGISARGSACSAHRTATLARPDLHRRIMPARRGPIGGSWPRRPTC